MPTEDILDFEALTAPIADDRPAGANLREDYSPESLYYRIKDARSAARDAERSAMPGEESEGTPQEWRTILKLAPKAIAETSKDLEVTAWMIEALLRLHGFRGLRDGLRLARELVERFWDDLYPAKDEDEYETRVAALAGLNGNEGEGTLLRPIALAPVTPEGERGAFGVWGYGKARDLSRTEDAAARQERVSAGAATLDHVRATATQADPQFFRDLLEDMDLALAEHAKLTAALDERCGRQSPPSSAIRNALQEARDVAELIARDFAGIVLTAPEPEPEPEAEAAPESAGAPAAAAAPGMDASKIRDRNEAFRILAKVAEYFRRNEPHSPLTSLIEKAIRWGHMPLEALMAELIPDQEARTYYERVTGVVGSDSHSKNDAS